MTLFAFIVANPILAGVIGAAAIAIPVVIHLINRRRFKIVEWAAMKFLLLAQKQTRKRMRIEQLLLLLTRMLILALIMFAMASVMPWAEAAWSYLGLANLGTAPRTTRIHHIFVLDASLSMNQVVGGQPAFEIARQQILKKIKDNPAGDGYSVLVLKDSPTWLVGEASQDYRKVMREIEAVKPTHGNASLASALNMVHAKLTESQGRFKTQAVYFVTDMQRATWLGGAPSDLKREVENEAYMKINGVQGATTIFVDVGADNPSNLAVTDMEFKNIYVTANTNVLLATSVQNFSSESKKDVRVEVLTARARDNANDLPMELRVVSTSKPLHFMAGERQTIEFDDFKFPSPGTYVVQVRLPDDPLNEDNTRSLVITVRDTIPILIVNGKASADRFERASEYLKLSLNPFPPGAEEKWAPLRPTVITPLEFADKSDAELERYDCIFWCDVGHFDGNYVRKIDRHLRRGGGFVVSLGERAADNLNDYNKLLFKEEQGILPAKLEKYGTENKVLAPANHNFYLQNNDPLAFTMPPLQAFSHDADRLTLRTARFRGFVNSKVPEGKARVILSFMSEVDAEIKDTPNVVQLPNASPAIVEWNPPLPRAQQPAQNPLRGQPRVDRQPARYRGKVILLTSTVNMDWTTWPGSPSFGAMMHELTRLALTGRLREQASNVGTMLEEFIPATTEIDVTMHLPAGSNPKSKRVRTQIVEETNFFRWMETDASGVYRLDSGGRDVPFAVNIPATTVDQKGQESDLGRLDESKLKDLYPGWKLQVTRNPLTASIAVDGRDDPPETINMPVGPFIANIALLLVLGLLFAEIVMAWYFGHYTTTEGALNAAPPGPTGTIVAGVVAIMSTILFAIGASIIAHEVYTGDFLGFLGDLFRGWFERIQDVPALQEGEGANWVYNKRPFLFGIPGPETWYALLITFGAAATIFFTYRAEAPRVSLTYKLLLGALRMYLILLTIWFLLPRPELVYARQGFPDMIILIDDSRSMGEPDTFQDKEIVERVNKLSESIRAQLEADIPGRIAGLEAKLAKKIDAAARDPDVKVEVDSLQQRVRYWTKQQELIKLGSWRPSRLQLIQAVLAQPEPHWLKTLLAKHRTKIHIFHLDVNGRATKLTDDKGDAGELINLSEEEKIERANKAIAQLDPVGNDSRLGTAVRQVIDHYNGSALSSVIMFTDGVTTRDESIAQVADYAASKGVALYFVGVGDEQQLRDLRLHDLNVDDPIYIGDTAVFEVRLTGQGYKDLTVPVVLKYRDAKDKNAVPKEVAREMVHVDPNGKSVRIRMRHQPKDVGRKTYIIEVLPPKLEGKDRPIAPSNLHVERTIEVIDTKLIKVLYVEKQPRYEFRYIKFLLEREALDQKKKKSIDLRVLLLDADEDFHIQDKAALKNFPPDLAALNEYDVLIFGDCDPNHNKLRNRLKDVVHYARGEDERGNKGQKAGGGVLFMAGAFHNPHQYKGTPLAAILPVEPLQNEPPADVLIRDPMPRPALTPAGKAHPMFRFSPDEGESLRIWEKLTPIYWNSSGYRIKPLAEVLAVHPTQRAVNREPNQDERHPIIVQQFVGTGRSMFFGIDETWRWRLREDESKFNTFWIQTMRYLSRGRTTRTDLRLDKQTPYRQGEEIKITVRFPENIGGSNPEAPKIDEKTQVKVVLEHRHFDAKDKETEKPDELVLSKVEGSWGTYEGKWTRTREGKYRIWLAKPDVSKFQPDGEKPSAEAIVELPPGELDKLRMNQPEMIGAATTTQGKFFSLAKADDLLREEILVTRPSIVSPVPPTLLWNQWWVFAIVLFLITSEWILRKWKHLL